MGRHPRGETTGTHSSTPGTYLPAGWSLVLKDSDGNAFTDDVGNPLQVGGSFEAGRPPGHPAGTSMPLAMGINLGPLPLIPGSRYVWELTIDDEGDDLWTAAFNVRPRISPARMAG